MLNSAVEYSLFCVFRTVSPVHGVNHSAVKNTTPAGGGCQSGACGIRPVCVRTLYEAYRTWFIVTLILTVMRILLLAQTVLVQVVNRSDACSLDNVQEVRGSKAGVDNRD